jgi:hypothetical protein
MDGSGRPAGGAPEPDTAALRRGALALLEANRRPEGHTVPSAGAYPHQWLWDSCFHVVCWADLGRPDAALAELAALFAHQADDGFVAHMTYWSEPDTPVGFWGRRWTSCLTQPPVYGHAVAELVRRGIAVPDDLVARAAAGLRFLLTARDRGDGRLVILHPWESGCDDSPRWDAWYPGGRWDPARGRQVKGDLVAAVRAASPGSPVASGAFEVASVAFAALVVFAVDELATVPGAVDADLAGRAAAVRAWLDGRWDAGRATFADEVVVGPTGPATPVRVVEALLPALVTERYAPVALRSVVDDAAFGGACGPAQVHRAEAAYDPQRYWRGPAWPPLTYLFWVAARRRDDTAAADRLRAAAMRGAAASGWAEYWHPDTGQGLGAVPQSWAALAAVMAGPPP